MKYPTLLVAGTTPPRDRHLRIRLTPATAGAIIVAAAPDVEPPPETGDAFLLDTFTRIGTLATPGETGATWTDLDGASAEGDFTIDGSVLKRSAGAAFPYTAYFGASGVPPAGDFYLEADVTINDPAASFGLLSLDDYSNYNGFEIAIGAGGGSDLILTMPNSGSGTGSANVTLAPAFGVMFTVRYEVTNSGQTITVLIDGTPVDVELAATTANAAALVAFTVHSATDENDWSISRIRGGPL